MRLMTLAATTLIATLRPGADYTIVQKGKAFSMTSLSVAKGAVVSFKNEDDVVHNVFTAGPTFSFNLKAQPPGVVSKVTFDTTGTFDVRCAIHPTMKLTVDVK